MSDTSFSFVLVCPVSADRMFKAFVLDGHNLAPKIMCQVISGARLIEGDGGVGSVKQFTFTEDGDDQLDVHGLLWITLPNNILRVIKQLKPPSCAAAVPFSHINEWVNVLDKDNLEYNYIVTEGFDVGGTKPISALCNVKFVPSDNGGCVVKATTDFIPTAWAKYTEEETTIGKDGVMGLFRAVQEHLYQAVEAHLIENPVAYA